MLVAKNYEKKKLILKFRANTYIKKPMMTTTTTMTHTESSLLEAIQNAQPSDETPVSHLVEGCGISVKLHEYYNHNGSKMKTPCYTKYSGNPLPYSLWNPEEIEAHNDFLCKDRDDGPPLDDKCGHWLLCLNNNIVSDEQYEEYGVSYTDECRIYVIDVDSPAELFKLYQNGFPVFNTPYTLSVTKRLPHYYVYMNGKLPYKNILGQSLADKRELDVISTYVFEKKSSNLINDTGECLYKVEDIAKWCDLDLCLFKPITHSHHQQRISVRDTGKKQPAVVKYQKKGGKMVKEELDFGSYNIFNDGEIIPFTQLKELLSNLNKERHQSHKEWFLLCRAVISMIDENSNPQDFLDLIQKFYDCEDPTHPYHNENINLFVKMINDEKYKGIGASYLWSCIHKDNRDVWLRLHFGNTRKIDPQSFKQLELQEAREVFNNQIAFIGGEAPVFVGYKPSINTFVYYKESTLIENYKNLHWTSKKQKLDDDGNPTGEFEKVINDKFVKRKWLEWTGRKQYEGLCFAPFPERSPHDFFNLYTGYDIDLIPDFDDEINQMSKYDMEQDDDLSFILCHLRYLAGQDKTDEVYQYQLKYFAHLIKYPGILPRTMLLWISVPGTGKNQLLNLLANCMGQRYYHSTANKDEVVGNFNAVIRNKLLINLNELKHAHEVMERIKELATEPIMSSTKKFQEPLRMSNFTRIVATSNNDNCMNVEFGDRRVVVVRNNPITASPAFKAKGYGAKLHKVISSVRTQKMWVRYCREFVNVTKDYNFETSRPITDEYKALKARNVPYQIRFFKYLYEYRLQNQKQDGEYTGPKLYQQFNEFCEVEGEQIKITKSLILNKIELYVMKKTSLQYLENNLDKFISLETRAQNKKQTKYIFNWTRLEKYLTSEGIDYETAAEGHNFTDTDDEDE